MGHSIFRPAEYAVVNVLARKQVRQPKQPRRAGLPAGGGMGGPGGAMGMGGVRRDAEMGTPLQPVSGICPVTKNYIAFDRLFIYMTCIYVFPLFV